MGKGYEKKSLNNKMKKLLLILLCVPLIFLGQETGCISGDCENGNGVYLYPNTIFSDYAGSKYIGEFKNGNFDGFGIFVHPNGTNYQGMFRQEKED